MPYSLGCIKLCSNFSCSSSTSSAGSKPQYPQRSGGHYKGALPAIPLSSSSRHYSGEDVDTGDYVSSSLLSSWRSSSTDRTACGSTAAGTRGPPAAAARSSSADSVRRIVRRFFAKKLNVRKAPSSSSSPLATAAGYKLEECPSPSALLKMEPSAGGPWDLPPNYVDMIFSRETQGQVVAVTTASETGSGCAVIKQV